MPSKSTFSKPYKTLTSLLVEERQKAGLTQSEVAQRLGKHQNYVSRYENAQKRLDLIELIWISDAVGFDIHKMIRKITKQVKEK